MARRTNGKHSAIGTLESFAKSDTCKLAFAADLLTELSRGLAENSRVIPLDAGGVGLNWNAETSRWDFEFNTLGPLTMEKRCILASGWLASPMVVFCTGSKPRLTPLSQCVTRIPLRVALAPSKLEETLSTAASGRSMVVGVVGASHSSILVLKNLVELAQKSLPHLQVRWFARGERLKYAVPKGDWILYDVSADRSCLLPRSPHFCGFGRLQGIDCSLDRRECPAMRNIC